MRTDTPHDHNYHSGQTFEMIHPLPQKSSFLYPEISGSALREPASSGLEGVAGGCSGALVTAISLMQVQAEAHSTRAEE